MSAQPEEHGGSHDVIHLGGETAVVVPLDEYRMLAALRDRASADEIEEAEIDAAIAGLAEDTEPPDAFVRGSYRRLRVGAYRVLYEVDADVVTIVRVDKVR